MGSQRAALQRDLAVLAEQIKAKEASAADERSAASAAQAALRTQLDAAEARLLGVPARSLNTHACAFMNWQAVVRRRPGAMLSNAWRRSGKPSRPALPGLAGAAPRQRPHGSSEWRN